MNPEYERNSEEQNQEVNTTAGGGTQTIRPDFQGSSQYDARPDSISTGPGMTDRLPDSAEQYQAVKPAPNAGLIVLQWLTYAFWGWTVLALSFLTATVVTSFITDYTASGATPYGIAAVLVLLPISFLCDLFYSRKEQEKKVGAEVWVMVIHAVIFALFGIGSLIAAVIAAVMLFTNGGDTETTTVVLISSLIIAGYYAITFLRTLNPRIFRWLQKYYKYIMLVTVSVIVVLGVVGPLAEERQTRNDRLIVSELNNLSESINKYAREEKKLPADLNTLDLRDDTKKLVDLNLVEYKPEGTATVTGPQYLDSRKKFEMENLESVASTRQGFKYQLCVTYTKESTNYGRYGYASEPYGDDEYTSYLSVYDHPAGKECYKVKTSEY